MRFVFRVASISLCLALAAPCLEGMASAATPVASLAAPAGLHAASETLAELLARAKAAAAPLHTDRSEDWTFNDAGEAGVEHDAYVGSDFREETTSGPFKTIEGRYHGQRYEQNSNGQTLLMQNVHAATEASVAALESGEALSAADGLTLLGQVDEPRPVEVVRVAPAGVRPRLYYYDKATALIVRQERLTRGNHVAVTTYDDVRPLAGGRRPYHIHLVSGLGDISDWHLSAVGPPPAVATLTIPGNRRTVVEFPVGSTRESIPARFVDGKILVRLTLGGHGYDFFLDSGADGIVVDPDVVARLGLKTFGHAKGEMAGQYVERRVVLPEIAIGRLKMHDVAATTLPFVSQPSDDAKAVGLLGFDFIADAVIHVSYADKTVEAILSESFDTAKLARPIEVPIALDDSLPYATASVGKATGNHFIVDTGADESFIFEDFAKAHPQDVSDAGGGKRIQYYYGYTGTAGVGGAVATSPIQLKSISFASTRFEDMIFLRMKDAPAYQDPDEDGIIGVPILRFFDVYFDYLNSRIVLVPNKIVERQPAPTK